MHRPRSRQGGFTLIEVLIVIVVIAVLAAIVVPRLLGAGRASKESSLRAHLKEVRDAVALFQAHCGPYPGDLQDICEPTFANVTDPANGITFGEADWQGPYLTTPDGNLPSNPVTGGNAEGTDWLYDAPTGSVSAAAGTSLDGGDYSTW